MSGGLHRFAGACALVAAAACSGPAGPASIPVPPPGRGLAPPSVSPVLAIAAFEMRSVDAGGGYAYEPSLVLTATAGRGAARLESITFTAPDQRSVALRFDSEAGRGCLRAGASTVIADGSSWNLESVARECLRLSARTDMTGRTIAAVITYVDDAGQAAVARGAATITRDVGPTQLEIDTFTVHASSAGGRFSYAVQFVLKETGGQAGAAIGLATLIDATGSSDTGCEVITRIEPHGTWDIETLGYCGASMPTTGFSPTATIRLTYTGDNGVPGVVTATARVTQ